jgi:hypothetical protein
MTTAGDARPEPYDEPEPTDADDLPPEDIDPDTIYEQLETEQDEAENYADKYAPDPGEDT